MPTLGEEFDRLFVRVSALERAVRELARAGHLTTKLEQDKVQDELRQIRVAKNRPERPKRK